MAFFCDPALLEEVGGFIDQVTEVDAEVAGERLNVSLFVDPQTARRVADIATSADKSTLLAWTVTEICKHLPSGTPALLRKAAVEAVAAIVLADELTEYEAAALSLPWCFASGT